MKVIYLINSKEYNYHKNLADDFVRITGGDVIDMGDGSNLGMRYYEIEKLSPDVIITFDLAGHLLRTGNDSLSLNNIYARSAHILFHKPDHYGRSLKVRQNLSMFTFIPNGSSTETARAGYPEVPNIEEFVPISYKPANDKEREENIENIKRWWDDFRREAML
ncbi:MAG: hypothetical protein IKE35_03665 [Lachnospiraceae bacterium]|nr:hypothetical protein [Lachnospiraceae bacterium]